MEHQETMVDIINRQVNLTKENAISVSEQIVEQFEHGAVDPFVFAGKLEFMLQTIEDAMTKIREKLLDEIHVYGKQGEEGIERGGIKFRKKESGVRYDFSNTEAWNRKAAELDAMKSEMKDMESQLKSLNKRMTIVDEESGEIIEMNPAIRTSKTIVEITIPKK